MPTCGIPDFLCCLLIISNKTNEFKQCSNLVNIHHFLRNISINSKVGEKVNEVQHHVSHRKIKFRKLCFLFSLVISMVSSNFPEKYFVLDVKKTRSDLCFGVSMPDC